MQAGGIGGSAFCESCASEATAPPRAVVKITGGTLEQGERGSGEARGGMGLLSQG